MAYNATVLPIMIASPGDVLEEREIARDVLHEWNYVNSFSTNVVLMPVGWETHSSPELGNHPQKIINERILKDCDLLVGIFWTRLGTPTEAAPSGSVEEIRKHSEAGKPTMLYFSTAPVAPQSLNQEQFNALIEFKKWCEANGLVQTYDNIVDFRQKFWRHLQITLNQNEYLNSVRTQYKSSNLEELVNASFERYEPRDQLAHLADGLSSEARELLLEAATDDAGTIIKAAFIGGRLIQANGKSFGDSRDRRSMARWESALDQLLVRNLVVERGYKGEIFELTDAGYQLADRLRNPQ